MNVYEKNYIKIPHVGWIKPENVFAQYFGGIRYLQIYPQYVERKRKDYRQLGCKVITMRMGFSGNYYEHDFTNYEMVKLLEKGEVYIRAFDLWVFFDPLDTYDDQTRNTLGRLDFYFKQHQDVDDF